MSHALPDLPGRPLVGRRAETAARVLDAVPPVIAETGYEALTVRSVAAAAGVSAQTAYNYFSTKEHLVAAVYWQRLSLQPRLDFPAGSSLQERVGLAVDSVALAMADEPELARVVTVALLSNDPSVVAIRESIGDVMAGRLTAACGDDVADQARFALVSMLVGTLLMAGLQMLEYRDLPGLLGGFAELAVDRGATDRP